MIEAFYKGPRPFGDEPVPGFPHVQKELLREAVPFRVFLVDECIPRMCVGRHRRRRGGAGRARPRAPHGGLVSSHAAGP
eukprot:2170017-Prymnesium_polylepis.1